MEIVGAALGHQGHLCAGGASHVSVATVGGHAEFLQGIERSPQGSAESIAAELIVVVETVPGDVGLIAAPAGHSAAAAVIGLIDLTADVGDTGLQAEYLDRIRPSDGTSASGLVLTVLPTLASWVLTSGASLFTSTVILVPSTCNVRFSVAGVLTCRQTFSCVKVANPDALALVV